MDKAGKLERYNRKDYGDLVEFPVEIVGRDGRVRCYGFEDSVRLYQRRISFAALRYDDDEITRAEIAHCRSRIAQLRRSFFFRFGWGAPDGPASPESVLGALAGELAAFLRRVLRVDGRPALRFDPLGDPDETWEGARSWRVVPDGAGFEMVLHAYRFDDAAASGAREAFFGRLKDLEGPRRPDAERLLAFHHTSDCGFVLAARAPAFAELAGAWAEADGSDDPVEPIEDVREVARRGELDAALARCRALVEAQPWHREAYVTGSVLAYRLGRYGEADDLAVVGSRYFPDEAVLHLVQGLVAVSERRVLDAWRPLARAADLEPGWRTPRLTLAALHAARGAATRAREAIAAAPERDAGLDRLSWALRVRSAGLRAGTLLVVVGTLGASGGLLGPSVVALGMMLPLGAQVWFQLLGRRLLRECTAGPLDEGVLRLGARLPVSGPVC